MIESNDWRLLNDVKHLKGIEVNPTDGKEITVHMESNQKCVFCWDKVSDNPHEYWYVTEGEKDCICEFCFQDFQDLFGFKVLDGWDTWE